MSWKFWKKSKIEVMASSKSKKVNGAVVAAPKPVIEEVVWQEQWIPIPPLDLMKIRFRASLNKSNRRGDVKYIVLHHTGPGSFAGIVRWLCNPQAKASAHYVLGAAGQLNQLVNTGRESWHAGRAKYLGQRIDNHFSIGIEICNYGVLQKGDDGNYYYEYGRRIRKYTGKVEPVPASITYPDGRELKGYAVPYPAKQLDKLIALCKALVKKYPQIGPEHVLTHFEVSYPNGRKNDPFGLDMGMVIKRIFDK